MKTVSERNGLEFTAKFFDHENQPAVPATVHWRLDCQTTGANLVDWTEETPVATYDDFGDAVDVSVEVEIPASANAIQQDSNRREIKELTVTAGKDTDREYSETITYVVVNRKRP